MEFIIKHTNEVLVSHSGLALAGAILQQSPLRDRLSAIQLGDRKRPTTSHGDVLLSMIGLLCLGKSDYADIEAYREEEFFRRALGLARLPSEETLRQRMDELGATPTAVLHEEAARLVARLLSRAAAVPGPGCCACAARRSHRLCQGARRFAASGIPGGQAGPLQRREHVVRRQVDVRSRRIHRGRPPSRSQLGEGLSKPGGG